MTWAPPRGTHTHTHMHARTHGVSTLGVLSFGHLMRSELH